MSLYRGRLAERGGQAAIAESGLISQPGCDIRVVVGVNQRV